MHYLSPLQYMRTYTNAILMYRWLWHSDRQPFLYGPSAWFYSCTMPLLLLLYNVRGLYHILYVCAGVLLLLVAAVLLNSFSVGTSTMFSTAFVRLFCYRVGNHFETKIKRIVKNDPRLDDTTASGLMINHKCCHISKIVNLWVRLGSRVERQGQIIRKMK